jgi:hypothetical protein
MTANNNHGHEGVTCLTSVQRNSHCPGHSHSGPSEGEEKIPIFLPRIKPESSVAQLLRSSAQSQL